MTLTLIKNTGRPSWDSSWRDFFSFWGLSLGGALKKKDLADLAIFRLQGWGGLGGGENAPKVDLPEEMGPGSWSGLVVQPGGHPQPDSEGLAKGRRHPMPGPILPGCGCENYLNFAFDFFARAKGSKGKKLF